MNETTSKTTATVNPATTLPSLYRDISQTRNFYKNSELLKTAVERDRVNATDDVYDRIERAIDYKVVVGIDEKERDRKLVRKEVEPMLPYFLHNVFNVIPEEITIYSKLPSIETLVKIGSKNLIELRRKLRKQHSELVKKLKGLESNYNVAKSAKSDNGYCAFCRTDRPQRPFGDCCNICPVFRDYARMKGQISFLNNLGTLKTPGNNNNDTQSDYYCPILQGDTDETRQAILSEVNEQIQELRKVKRLVNEYMTRIKAALINPQTLDNLPLFPDWRPQSYLSNGDIVLVFRAQYPDTNAQTINGELNLANFKPCQFIGQRRMYHPFAQTEFFLSDGDLISCDYSLRYCGILYNSIEDIELSLSDAEDVPRALLPDIHRHTPYVMKPEELTALQKNPQYALMWAYTNRDSTYAHPAVIEPMLKALGIER